MNIEELEFCQKNIMFDCKTYLSWCPDIFE